MFGFSHTLRYAKPSPAVLATYELWIKVPAVLSDSHHPSYYGKA